MTPFAELPQWINLGPDQDFASPTASLVDTLKKRMKRKPEGAGDLNESPAYSDLLGGSLSAPKNGVKSL